MADRTLQLDPATTALVLIDLQKGIVARPCAPYPAQAVVDRARRLADACRVLGAPVVLVHVAYSADGRDRLGQPVDTPLGGGPTPPEWAEFVPELAPHPGDIVLTKRNWGAFYGTELDLQLRRRGVRTILLGGISTNFGVESTGRAAFEHGYAVVFVEDAMAGPTPDAHRFAVGTVFPRIGRVRSCADVLAALGAIS